jgi:beta-galactosidase
MQRLKQNIYESAWSEEKSVRPDGKQPPSAPVIKGVLYQNDETLICFEPVKKATGYLLQYKKKKSANWTTLSINAGLIEHYKISGLKNNSYNYRMAAITSNGVSEFSNL